MQLYRGTLAYSPHNPVFLSNGKSEGVGFYYPFSLFVELRVVIVALFQKKGVNRPDHPGWRGYGSPVLELCMPYLLNTFPCRCLIFLPSKPFLNP